MMSFYKGKYYILLQKYRLTMNHQKRRKQELRKLREREARNKRL